MNSLSSMSGPTWWCEMNVSTSRPESRSIAPMNSCRVAVWKVLRVCLTIAVCCSQATEPIIRESGVPYALLRNNLYSEELGVRSQ